MAPVHAELGVVYYCFTSILLVSAMYVAIIYFDVQVFASSGEQSILLEWCGDLAHVDWNGHH